MKTTLTFFLLFLSFLGKSQIQQSILDSLWGIWQNNSIEDTTRIKALDSFINKGYLYVQPDSAYYFAQIQVDYANSKGLLKLEADGLKTQGTSYSLRGDFFNANQAYQGSLELYTTINYKKGIAGSLNNLGLIYYNLGDKSTALEYYKKALLIKQEIKDRRGVARTLNNIGQLYLDEGNYPHALKYYQQSLSIKEDLQDYNGIAGSYHAMGNALVQLGDIEGSLAYHQKSLKIRLELGNKIDAAKSYGNIGVSFKNMENYPEAISYTKKSLELQKETNDKSGASQSYYVLGTIFIDLKDYHSSINYCKNGYKLALAAGSLKDQRNACECLYNSYKEINKNKEALNYLENYILIIDSITEQETAIKLQQMEFQKEITAKKIAKEKETKRIEEAHKEEIKKKEKVRNIAVGSSGFVLLIALGLFNRLRFTRKSKEIIEKEKDRSDNLLLNILPEEIAQELKEKGRADARDFDMVSILFSDFIGFTKASAKLSAQNLVKEINTYFEAFDGIIEKYGIEKIKTIGDAYMAAGGLPVPTDEAVKNTVFAALAMQAFIQSRKVENDKKGKPAFEMRVGIHTGPVVAGIVGVKKFQYDIWGDTVNTASRMESSGEVGKVNISQTTYELLKDDPVFTFESRGKIEAKGKGKIEMLFVSLKR